MFMCLKLTQYLKYYPKTASHSRNIYYQYNYNIKIDELLNKQIQAEQQAAQDYLKMSVSFLHPSKSQFGAGGYFMKMYYEEIQHMQQFINYQIVRGGNTLICGLEAPRQNNDLTLIEAFKQGLTMEKTITKQIEESIVVAEDVNDRNCADFLSVFLAEQMQSIHEMAMHITKLTRLCNDEHALSQYDLELAKLYPYSLKTK